MKHFENFNALLILVSCLIFLTGCPANNEVENYPDVAGTWDWIVTFTQMECPDPLPWEYNIILVLTQNEGTGTWRAFDYEDPGLTCPLEEGTYTMDTEGNVTISLTDYKFDPGDCNQDTPGDAYITLNITAVATSTQMTGTQTEYWTSVSMGVTDCLKVGTVTATKR